MISFWGNVIVWGAGLAALIIALIVVLVLILALHPSGRMRGSAASVAGGTSTSARKGAAARLSQEEKTLLTDASRRITRLHQLALRADIPQIRETAGQLCGRAELIVSALRDKPDAIPKTRQFLSYYLPTIEKVMEKYMQMKRGGAADEQMTGKVLECLRNAHTAAEKQYQNLFEADILDLTVEIEVMTAFCRQDGLLTGGESAVQSEEQDISLTL